MNNQILSSIVIVQLSAGCIPTVELPIGFQIVDEFSDEELTRIFGRIDEVNSSIGYYYGEDVLVYDPEPYSESDEFDLGDLSDGRRVIYKIFEGSDTYKKLRESIPLDEDLYDWDGSALYKEDMILVNIDEATTRWSDHNVMHEFGHWLGIMHRDDPTSAMNPISTGVKFSIEDTQAFCLSQDCEISPFPEKL